MREGRRGREGGREGGEGREGGRGGEGGREGGEGGREGGEGGEGGREGGEGGREEREEREGGREGGRRGREGGEGGEGGEEREGGRGWKEKEGRGMIKRGTLTGYPIAWTPSFSYVGVWISLNLYFRLFLANIIYLIIAKIEMKNYLLDNIIMAKSLYLLGIRPGQAHQIP